MDKVTSDRAVLLFRAGAKICGAPVEAVVETMRPLPVEPLAGAAPSVRGVSLVRGAPVPVIDAARLVGATPDEDVGRFVVLAAGQRRMALAVAAVLGVRRIGAQVFEHLPPLLGASGRQAVEWVGVLDAQSCYLLNASRIVPDSVWRMLAEATAAGPR